MGKLFHNFFTDLGKNKFFWQNIHLCCHHQTTVNFLRILELIYTISNRVKRYLFSYRCSPTVSLTRSASHTWSSSQTWSASHTWSSSQTWSPSQTLLVSQSVKVKQSVKLIQSNFDIWLRSLLWGNLSLFQFEDWIVHIELDFKDISYLFHMALSILFIPWFYI